MSDAATFYVYCLFRPDGRPFYIGKGKGKRWAEHSKPSKIGRTRRGNIIRAALAAGQEVPKVKLATGLTEGEAFALERAFIAAIGRAPHGPLVNHTDGGEGVSGHRHSPATRQKMSLAKQGKPSPKRGVPLSPEQREAFLRNGRKGLPSPNKGKRMSDAQRAKLSSAHTGKTLSDAHRQKITESLLKNPPNLGRAFSDEVRANMSAAHLGKKRSPESIANHAAAMRRSWARRKASKQSDLA